MNLPRNLPITGLAVLILLLADVASIATVNAAEPSAAFRQTMAAKAEELAKSETIVLPGQDEFFFLTSELRHYGRGQYWGPEAAKESAARNNQDPSVAILDFHRQLKAAGISLILVPVPGKAAVYGDKIDAKLDPAKRLDQMDQAFIELLRQEGVIVVDLLPDMLTMRQAGQASHCRQDTHWTPAAAELAAKKVADLVKEQSWYKDVPKGAVKVASQDYATEGDLIGMLESAGQKPSNISAEKLTLHTVTLDGQPVSSVVNSPLLLIGDSHTLVYHQPIPGGITATGAGLFEHLAAQLQIAPELVANAGSGANAPRITLARPPRYNNLAETKCVVWCFTVRELTEGGQGWAKIPVIR